MSATQQVTEREARAVAEAARETEWSKPSFVRELFLGRLRLDLIDPLPVQDADEQARGAEFLARLEKFVVEEVDALRIEREDRVPPEVLDGLRKLGCFGIKIPREYGGLGFGQRTYSRAIALVGSRCSALAVSVSAHQSVGVPHPLKMFGTEEKK